LKTYSTITRCHHNSRTIYQIEVIETTEDGDSSVLVEIGKPLLGDNTPPRHVMLGIAQAARAWLEQQEAQRAASIEAQSDAELATIVGRGK
jgi:hypothetical protein